MLPLCDACSERRFLEYTQRNEMHLQGRSKTPENFQSQIISIFSFYFLEGLVGKNCTVTRRPIWKDFGFPSKPITASRTSRSLLSDGSPVEMLFLPIMEDILTTDPLSFCPSRASARITTFCPTDALSTSRSSISALICREEVSARLNNGRGVSVLKDSPGLAKTRKTVPSIGARI